MDTSMSFIERQFPVSKVSKESFKERKAVQSQTLTGLGKWWGRKPLILVRAAILGCLMPVSDNPKKDTDIFLKILSMDKPGLADRKDKRVSPAKLYEIANRSKHFRQYIDQWFAIENGKPKFKDGVDKDDVESRLFNTLGYDERLDYCCRPEHLDNIRDTSWNEINEHLGTKAHSLQELVSQLSMKRYGRLVTVGDCFSGGGSIPFEAARTGTNVYASDLNPVATLLSWADINILGNNTEKSNLLDFQDKLLSTVQTRITKLGVEINEHRDTAINYLYCTETICPECGYKIPISSSWLVGVGSKTVAILSENEAEKHYDIHIKMNATSQEMKEAEKSGTTVSGGIRCPHCGKTTPVSSLRHDTIDDNGNTVYGLRLWEKNEFEPRPNDIYQERLYAIRYENITTDEKGKEKTTRYYREPTVDDLINEQKVHDIVSEHFTEWQEKGYIPSLAIESGAKTDEVMKTRGWAYWHQLFNSRQLLITAIMIEEALKLSKTSEELALATLIVNRAADWNSKLCRWGTGQARESMAQTFYNQALNTMWQYGTRGYRLVESTCKIKLDFSVTTGEKKYTAISKDARDVDFICDYWITDPPYADAVNYHELSEFFLAWDKALIKKAFPDWYTDSKRILAVRGDEHFSETMIEIYSNLAKHMPDNGMQIVMFTHSDPAVWAQLAIIMWKAGLKVTAAWNIATETEASGLKSGNYVKGTVLLVLRKQTGDEEAFLDEIDADIRSEVKRQIDSKQTLDDKEEPNFSDPDYVLAAYAASLKVLTSYAEIEDLNLDYELTQAITNPSKSEVVKIIESAKRIAYDCVIPSKFEGYLWKELSNSERFYIKGLESEMHGDYQIATYQEYARGFSIGGYSQLMANEKANTARLKTPFEMASRSINDVSDFENSLMRVIFTSIYVGIKEEMNPQKALGYIKSELANYWDKREMIKQILSFLVDCQDISNMQPHWTDSAKMAELLLASVTHDSI